MTNPLLIKLTRGKLVESFHRGALCMTGANGIAVVGLGDIDSPVYPRSAIKALQTLPLVESGAADAAGLTDKELALTCASHNGEPLHVQTARGILEKSGLTPDALACGSHWPMDQDAARALAAEGAEPTPLHNNCSGKHAGMLTLAVHLKADVEGYERPDHPVQQRIRATIEELTGAAAGDDVCAVDGCSVPTWALPLRGIASAFARLASGEGLSPQRAEAARRLVRACTANPFMVEGTGRFGTGVMRRLGAASFVKGGAEGVYCAVFPETGLGLALKIDDGARRGAEAVAAFVIAAILNKEIGSADELFTTRLTNWRGTRVGEVAPSEELGDGLADLRRQA